MLENTLTLVLPHDGTPQNVTATRIGNAGNDKSLYNLTGHTPLKRKTLAFGRTYPKRNGAFYGVARGSVKITLDREVLDAKGATIISPDILDVSINMPVGAAEVNVNLIADYLAALAARRDILTRMILGPEI